MGTFRNISYIVRLWKAGRPDWNILVLSINSSESFVMVHMISHLLSWYICCNLRGPSGERIVYDVPERTKLELQVRRGVGQAAHASNNPHVNCLLCINSE